MHGELVCLGRLNTDFQSTACIGEAHISLKDQN